MQYPFLARAGIGVLLMFGACFGDDPAQGGRNPAVGVGKGTVGFSILVDDESITAVKYEVSSGGEVVAEAIKELETEALPSSIFPGDGEVRRFADAYFMLESGTYSVRAVLLKREGEDLVPADECAEVIAPAVKVHPGQTNEITLVSQCQVTSSGGLDVIVVVPNHIPEIADLQFDPSKFIVACEPLQVTVTASEDDGPAVSHTWMVTGPDGADFDVRAEDGVLHFSARTPGDYEAVATVCDSLPDAHQACSSLTFPIHVSLGEDSDGDGVGDLCGEPGCVPECKDRECGPDPVCGVSCGPPCAEGTVCNGLGYCEPEQPCKPKCGARECGPDPVCGISCGPKCPNGEVCSAEGFCEGPVGRGGWLRSH